MDVITYTDEYTSPITPARLFKALILDAHNLIPKLIPQAIKSIEFTQGDGGAGSIRQITFAEGDALAEKLEFITHEVQYEPTPDGGSKNKMTKKYHTKGDIVIKEEDIKAGKEKTLGMYKVAEPYLLQNPDAYA
ncbi:hypothetical protein CIPAW_02G078400 [Carya illinoinensis]|uniref:Bet v I/Major latex protein domain-containing protein n=1 Tax=Carya illinoinensis TaxID=32201 RepID=A0A8T1RBD7_CARIL|nr:hypothetical protein CIPAW_02G078400 [Carya illinoinensis]